MPKASSTLNKPTDSYVETPLRRNEACIQCRKRKIKCDAQRPCKGCIRHHSRLIGQLAVKGLPFSTTPECTYDDVDTGDETDARSPAPQIVTLASGLPKPSEKDLGPTPQGSNEAGDSWSALGPTEDLHAQLANIFSSGSTNNLELDSLPFDPGLPALPSSIPSRSTTPIFSPPVETILWPNYPPNLPPLDLVFHLVEVFFTSVPYASHLIHRSTFISSLTFPPSDSRFPSPCLLHAICGLAGMYSPVMDHSHTGTSWTGGTGYRAFRGETEIGGTFQDNQIDLATALSTYDSQTGKSLFQALQAKIIVTWYHSVSAHFADSWGMSGNAARFCIPLGLNTSPSRHTILSKGLRQPSVLPPPRDVIDLEQRRNALWLTYVLDRGQSATTGWACCMQDLDISQELPIPLRCFDQGINYTGPRQTLASPDLFCSHPAHLTDSFVLLVKSFALLSRVMNFNGRTPASDADLPAVRELPAFRDLEHCIYELKTTWPVEYKDPFAKGNGVDVVLFLAHLVTLGSIILLYNAHSDIASPNSIPAQKILSASHAITSLVFDLSATTFDLIFIPPHALFYWFEAGQTLIAFYQHSLEKDALEEAVSLKEEIEALILACGRFGARIPSGVLPEGTLKHCLANAAQEAQQKKSGVPKEGPSWDQLVSGQF